MSDLHDDLRSQPNTMHVWAGVISDDVVSMSDRANVRIPDMNDELVFEDVRWQARDATSTPNGNDDCLVIFDNNREPWVVAWWPFST